MNRTERLLVAHAAAGGRFALQGCLCFIVRLLFVTLELQERSGIEICLFGKSRTRGVSSFKLLAAHAAASQLYRSAMA